MAKDRHSRPLSYADASVAPLRARSDLPHKLLEEPAPVTGAFDVRDDRPRRQPEEVVEAEVDGTLDGVALDAQPPGADVQDGGRRVLADEEVAGRGQVSPERLQSDLLVDPMVDEDIARHGLRVELLGRCRLGHRLGA